MKRILIAVADGADEMEFVPYLEMPGWTKVVPGIERVDMKVVGWDEKIYLFHGMMIYPNMLIDEVTDEDLDDYDALCIPGGWHGTRYFDQVKSETLQSWIKKFHAEGKIVSTCCTGICAVGEAGLLVGGKKATCFQGQCCELCQNIKQVMTDYGSDFREDMAMVTTEDKIMSSIGPAVGDEHALKLMEMLIGKEDVEKIVHYMMYDRVQPKLLEWTHARDCGPPTDECCAPKEHLPETCCEPNCDHPGCRNK